MIELRGTANAVACLQQRQGLHLSAVAVAVCAGADVQHHLGAKHLLGEHIRLRNLQRACGAVRAQASHLQCVVHRRADVRARDLGSEFYGHGSPGAIGGAGVAGDAVGTGGIDRGAAVVRSHGLDPGSGGP